jgi:hypothetical protein
VFSQPAGTTFAAGHDRQQPWIRGK